jgi:hypothetical protein
MENTPMADDKDKENEGATPSVSPAALDDAEQAPRARRPRASEFASPSETIPGGRYINTAGHYINAEGQYITFDGKVVDEPVKASK